MMSKVKIKEDVVIRPAGGSKGGVGALGSGSSGADGGKPKRGTVEVKTGVASSTRDGGGGGDAGQKPAHTRGEFLKSTGVDADLPKSGGKRTRGKTRGDLSVSASTSTSIDDDGFILTRKRGRKKRAKRAFDSTDSTEEVIAEEEDGGRKDLRGEDPKGDAMDLDIQGDGEQAAVGEDAARVKDGAPTDGSSDSETDSEEEEDPFDNDSWIKSEDVARRREWLRKGHYQAMVEHAAYTVERERIRAGLKKKNSPMPPPVLLAALNLNDPFSATASAQRVSGELRDHLVDFLEWEAKRRKRLPADDRQWLKQYADSVSGVVSTLATAIKSVSAEAIRLREELKERDKLIDRLTSAVGSADKRTAQGGEKSTYAARVRSTPAASGTRGTRVQESGAGTAGAGPTVPPPRVTGVGRVRRRAACTVRLHAVVGSAPLDPGVVEAKLREVVDPKRDGIKIDRIRRVGGDCLYVDLGSRADVNKLTGHEGLRKAEIEAKEPVGRRPRVIIYDVPSNLEMAALREQIVDHDADRLGERGLDLFKKGADFRFKTGPRGQPSVNWVMEVPAELRSILKRLGALRFAWQRCRVDDFVGLSRCYRCCRLGHVAKTCRHDDACRTCGEDGHQSKDCRAPAGTAKCADCRRSGRAWDHACDRTCPAYKRAVAVGIGMTDYGIDTGRPPDAPAPVGASTPRGPVGDGAAPATPDAPDVASVGTAVDGRDV